MKRHLTYLELSLAAQTVAKAMLDHCTRNSLGVLRVYAVPRGGVPAFYLVERWFATLCAQTPVHRFLDMAATPAEADCYLDDLVDSGNTRQRLTLISDVPFYALIEKGTTPGFAHGEWLVFPWEESEEKSIEDAFVRLIQFVGEDPKRGGLVETPARMAKAWEFWTAGYKADPVSVLKTFEDGGEHYDEMVHTKGIPFYSQCEHHLAPFFGTVTFAYVPDKHIVGLSKMNRLVDVFARRLQVQERLTCQIIDAFCEHLSPLGAGITIKARHLCVESRGVCQQGTVTTTSAFRGVIKDKPEARAEFFSLAHQP